MRIFVDGEKVNDNLVKKFKGNGSFAEVYHVYNESSCTNLALKVCFPNAKDGDKILFKRENEILHKLKIHNNIIIPFTDIETYNVHMFYLMELADCNLNEYIFSHTSVSDEDRLFIFKKICSALQYAHTKKVVHRDLWWNNILMKTTNNEDVPKVSDFGRAKDFDNINGTNVPLEIWGHQFVCPPEIFFKIWTEQQLNNYLKADIYALGINLYYLFYGEPTMYFSALINSYSYFFKNMPDISTLSESERLSQYDNWLIWTNNNFPQTKLGLSLNNIDINIKLNNIIEKLCHLDYKKRYKKIDDVLLDLEKI